MQYYITLLNRVLWYTELSQLPAGDPTACSDLAVAVEALFFVFDLFELQLHHYYQDNFVKREE